MFAILWLSRKISHIWRQTKDNAISNLIFRGHICFLKGKKKKKTTKDKLKNHSKYVRVSDKQVVPWRCWINLCPTYQCVSVVWWCLLTGQRPLERKISQDKSLGPSLMDMWSGYNDPVPLTAARVTQRAKLQKPGLYDVILSPSHGHNWKDLCRHLAWSWSVFVRYLALGLRYLSLWPVCLNRGNVNLGALRKLCLPKCWGTESR